MDSGNPIADYINASGYSIQQHFDKFQHHPGLFDRADMSAVNYRCFDKRRSRYVVLFPFECPGIYLQMLYQGVVSSASRITFLSICLISLSVSIFMDKARKSERAGLFSRDFFPKRDFAACFE